MQIEVNELEPCKLNVTYTADATEILDKKAEILAHFKKAPVSGFRPGKAPLEAISVQYRTQIEESLKRALAEDAFHNTLFEKKIKPHGPPRFNSVLLAGGKFVCEFDVHTKPIFELQPFNTFEIPRPHVEMTDIEMTEKILQDLRVRLGESVPFTEDDFIEAEDSVILNYEGFIDGERVPHLCAEGDMITAGHSNIPQFDENILGMTLGETREFDIFSPENSLPSLSGKNVHLKVTLMMGSKNTPCALDNTLAEKAGRKDLEDLRAFAAATATATLENKAKGARNEAICNKLLEVNTVDVPNWMSLSEAQYLAHHSKIEWNDLSDEDREKYISMAEKNVKLTLILDAIREDNPEAQLTDQEVFELIKANLAKTNVSAPIDDVIQQMNKTGYLQILFSRIRDEHTLDFIGKQVKLID